MRISPIALGTAALLLAGAHLAAQTPGPPPPTMNPWFAERPKAPLAPRASVQAPPSRPAQPTQQIAPTAPTVVCGMAVVPADPKIDPTMVKKVAPADNTRYAMRVVEPAVCRR